MNERFSLVDRAVPYLHEKQIEREARFILDQYELKFERKVTAPVPLEKITEFQLQLTLEFKDMKSLFPFADVHGAIWFEEGIIGIDQSLNPDEIDLIRPAKFLYYSRSVWHMYSNPR